MGFEVRPEVEENTGRGGEYRVLVTRYRDWWHIEVPTLDVHAQSRLLRDTEPAARAAISSKLETGADSFDVSIELQPAFAEKLPVSSYLTSRALGSTGRRPRSLRSSGLGAG